MKIKSLIGGILLDANGDDNSNMNLFKKRAKAVKAILTSDFGINNYRIESDDEGEIQPVGDHKTF